MYWYDLVTLKRKGGGHEHDHDQHDVVVRMPQQPWCAPHKQHCAHKSQPTTASTSSTGPPFAQATSLHRSRTSVARSRSSWESLGRLTRFAFTTDGGGGRVSCRGHRSSSAQHRGSPWATTSCLPVARQGCRGVPPCGGGVRRRRTLHTHQETGQTGRSLSKGGGQLKARHAE
jgi:hypothetical protein